MLVVVKSFEAFNKRRYSDPWVAKVTPDGRLDFTGRCGGYTGGYHTGDAGGRFVPVDKSNLVKILNESI